MGDTHYGGVVASEGVKVGTKYSKTTVIDASGNIVNAPSITRPYLLKAANYTVLAAESGTIFGMATNAKTFTLPTVAEGLFYTFVNVGGAANNNIIIDSDAAEIFGTFTLAGTIVIADAETILTNTQGSSIKGDSVTLVSDGTAWFIIGSTGIWAATAPG